jgi:hypothetical protein
MLIPVKKDIFNVCNLQTTNASNAALIAKPTIALCLQPEAQPNFSHTGAYYCLSQRVQGLTQHLFSDRFNRLVNLAKYCISMR